jgi:integrase
LAHARKIGKTWRAIWQLPERAPDGRHKEGSESGFRTKKSAEAYAEAQEAAIRAGTWIDPERGKISLDDYWQLWLASRRLSDSTKDRYTSYYRNHLLPEWGERPIAAITPLEVDGLEKKLYEEKRLKSGTVDPIMELLGRILGSAAFERRIGFSPVRPAKERGGARPDEDDEREGIAITLEQLLAICARLPRPEALLVLTTAFTGMRWGEAAGMRRKFLFLQPAADGEPACGWYEIDKKVGALKERGGHLSFGPPKTREERTIQLPPFLVALLLAYLETIPAKRQLLFPCGSGEGYRRGNFGRQLWRPACDGWPARAKSRGHAAVEAAPPIVPTLRFHDLRHTHETWLSEDHMEKVARDARLGHVTPGMEGIYNHVTPTMERQILDVLERRWASIAATSRPWP